MYETFGNISLTALLSALSVRNNVNEPNILPVTNSSGNHTLIHEKTTQIAVGI